MVKGLTFKFKITTNVFFFYMFTNWGDGQLPPALPPRFAVVPLFLGFHGFPHVFLSLTTHKISFEMCGIRLRGAGITKLLFERSKLQTKGSQSQSAEPKPKGDKPLLSH